MPEGTISLRDAGDENGRPGSIDVELRIDGERVSRSRIIPLTIRIGASEVKVDGIGLVETAESHRGRGFSRRVLEVAVERMEQGEAALSMLYGITDFYPKFGYKTVGPEATLVLPPADKKISPPPGWQVRGFRAEDLPAVRSLYQQATPDSVGTALRPNSGHPWPALLATAQHGESRDCKVVVTAAETVVGYVWRGEKDPFVTMHSDYNPDSLVLAEAVAVPGWAADVVVQVCRNWALEEAAAAGRAIRDVRTFMPAEGAVADAARHIEATLRHDYGPDGGWMGRVLSVERLLRSLQPELSRRLKHADLPLEGCVRIVTELGSATLDLKSASLTSETVDAPAVHLPQTALARLVHGAYAPEDILSRAVPSILPQIQAALVALFPKRDPQLYLADRF